MKNLILLFTTGFLCSLNAQTGILWEVSKNIATNSFGNLHPRITCNDKGEAYILWGRSSDQSAQFSKWDGQKFNTPIKLNKGFNIAAASWMGPDMASRNDTIYVIMKAIPEDNPNSHIYLTRSFDGGNTFLDPVQVDNINTDISRFPTIAIDQDGNPIVAFMKFNASFRESRWVVTRSEDYGNSFMPDIKVSGWKGAEEVCDCCPGSFVCSDNSCALFYRNNDKNVRDSWVSLSSDKGRNFTAGFNIDNSNWIINSCPASGPDGILLNNTIYSVFMSGAANPTSNYFSTSSLADKKFTTITKLNNNIAGLNNQNFPRIASNGTALGLAWIQNVAGKAQLPLLFTNDITSNKLPPYEIVDSIDITNTDIAISKDKVFVVWQDDISRTIKFRAGSYQAVLSSIKNQDVKSGEIEYSLLNNSTHWTIKPNSKNEIISVELFDLLGKRIYQKNSNLNFEQIQLNKNELPVGIYFLKISCLNKSVTIKLTK